MKSAMKFEVGDTVHRAGDNRPWSVQWDHTDGRLTIRCPNGGADLRDTVEPDTISYANVTLAFFRYGHLPATLQEVSKRFHALAHEMALTLPPCQQLDLALQKLLEAKDAAVRARLPA